MYQSHFVTSPDGTALHYLHWPNTNSDSLCILLHGFTNDAHIFDGISKQLQKHHQVVSIDFRGHGDSDWDKQARYSHEQLIADTVFIIKQFDIPLQRMHILGHSLGARIAALMLSQQSWQARSFCIIDTGPEVRQAGVNKVRQDAQSTPKTFQSQAAYLEFLQQMYFLAQPEKLEQLAYWGVKAVNGEYVPKTDPAFTQALWTPQKNLRTPLNEQLWQALKNIHCRCLILRGQASAILSQQTAEKMAVVMSNAQVEVIARAGHALMVDNPEAFERAVLGFIEHS